MESIKRAFAFIAALLVCLGLMAVPALADNPWTEAPQFGLEGGDKPPGPKGGPIEESSGYRPVRVLTYTGFIIEISYRLTEFIYPDGEVARVNQDSSESTEEVRAKTLE